MQQSRRSGRRAAEPSTRAPPLERIPLVNGDAHRRAFGASAKPLASLRPRSCPAAPANSSRVEAEACRLERRFTFPIALTEPSQGILQAYAISTIPTSVLVDKEGVVKSVHVGLAANTVEGIYEAFKEEIEAAR